MAIIGGLHYFEIIDVLSDFWAHFLDCIKILASFIIPIVVLLVLAIYTFLSSKEFVSGQRFRNEKAAGKTENIAFSINTEH